MRGPSDTQASNDHLEALYRDCYKAIFAYVLRRTSGDTETVADLVAEVFVVALRKQDAIPPCPEDRLWLYGVARRVLLDHRRRHKRLLGLLSVLQAQATSETDSGYGQPAARVLGCTPNAVALRLHKARSRLRRILSPSAVGAAHESRSVASQFAPDGSRSHL